MMILNQSLPSSAHRRVSLKLSARVLASCLRAAIGESSAKPNCNHASDRPRPRHAVARDDGGRAKPASIAAASRAEDGLALAPTALAAPNLTFIWSLR